jgi:hypothetical protein
MAQQKPYRVHMLSRLPGEPADDSEDVRGTIDCRCGGGAIGSIDIVLGEIDR